jgi:hypothetical protein
MDQNCKYSQCKKSRTTAEAMLGSLIMMKVLEKKLVLYDVFHICNV